MKKTISAETWWKAIGISLAMLVLFFSSRNSPDEPAGFTSWDGSHIELTRWVKRQLKDPDSFEHIETVYWKDGDNLRVQMKYRARNSLGGMVNESVLAKTNRETGALIEIIE